MYVVTTNETEHLLVARSHAHAYLIAVPYLADGEYIVSVEVAA